MSLRVFIALDLDEAVKKDLLRLQNRLAAVGADVGWVQSQHMHLTLKFLGDIPEQTAVDVCRLAQNVSAAFEPFEFQVRGAGCFANHGRPRVVWVAVDDAGGQVRRLQQQLEKTLKPLGLRQELRTFKPHITLGRVRSPRNALDLRKEIEKNEQFDAGLQQAQEITIYSSQLGSDGPTHTIIGRAKFRATSVSPLDETGQ